MIKQAPFKPTDIGGCQLWLDGADATSTGITLSGTSVISWNDKSGNAYNLTQGTAGSQPSYSANLITFSSNKYLNIPQAVMNNAATWSLFFVINPISSSNWIMVKQRDGQNTYNVLSMTINTNSGGGGQTGSTGFLYWRSFNAGSQAVSTAALTTSTLQICNLTYDGTNLYFYKNGVLEKTTTGTFAIQNDTNATNYTLGVWIQGGGFVNSGVTNFQFGELNFYSSFLNLTQRQQIEAYLAQKWGLRQQLPQGHPGTRGIVYPSQPIPTAIYWRYQSAFVPTQIQPGTCQLWLDGSDTTTITGTTAVSAWTDKSGNGNNTTIFGTPNSTYGTINSVKAMWFNGSSGTYGLFSNTGATVSGFVVGTMNSATATYGRMIALGNNPGNDDSGTLQCPFLLRHIGNQAFSTRRFQTNYTYSSYTYDAPFLASIIYDGTNGNLYVNGSTIVQFGSTGNFGYSNYSVGCGIYSISANTVDTWTGFVGEVILYRSALTSIQQQQVEGYLAWKWGLQANLPANHPYKNSSPNITNPAGISRPANVLPIPSIVCYSSPNFKLVTAGLMLHVDAGNPASYPGSGSTWYDLTTSGLNVTLFGSPTYSSANGGYIAFTPSSSQYGGTSGTYNSGSALTTWTTEAWHYYTNVTVGNLSAIICSTYAGNVNFALGSPVGGASGKNLAAAYFAGTWYYTSSSYTLPSVGWYHLVGTYDGTNLKLYVNNVLTQTQASAVTPGFGGGEIRLMRRWDVGDYWGGYLAIARVYRRALSADEVNTNYQVSKARFGLS